VPFGIEELFYSRTDLRGVILAGNPVFRRVAGYDWGQLIGAPHRIVRHPATPKAVFRILWKTIEQGEPAVAYVCNRAADGRPYWVLATVLPFGDTYLSVRIKPTSGLLARVKDLYAETAAAEQAGLGVDASTDRLLTTLREAGFADYGTFMRHALAQETAARAAALNAKAATEEVGRIRKGLSDVIAEQEALVGDFERLRILPTNMRILASRLEPTGGPVGAISDIYLMISADIFSKVGAFSRGDASLCKRMSECFEKAIFLMTCSHMQAEVASGQKAMDLAGSGIDCAAEIAYLDQLGTSYRALAAKAMEDAMTLARNITEASIDLKRAMLSLETITVMGRVESARIGADGMRINATINQLHEGNMVISRLLGVINELSGTLNNGMRSIRGNYLSDDKGPTNPQT
jgi:aerotaxis receptor